MANKAFTVKHGLNPITDGSLDIGTSSLEFQDLYIDGTAFLDAIGFGTTSVTLPSGAGDNGQVLKTNGSNALAWSDEASSGHVIQEEGSGLTARSKLNFIGAGVTAADDSGNDATTVTVEPTGASLPLTRDDGSTSDPITLTSAPQGATPTGASMPLTRKNGSTSDPIALISAALGEHLVSDTTPQLGGSLDVNGNAIVSASNANIAITPNGSGKIVLDGISWPNADGSPNYVLKTNGSGVLSWAADAAGTITALNNATANELVTVGSTTTELDAESNLTFDGSTLAVTGAVTMANAAGPTIVNEAATATNPTLIPNKAEVDTGYGWAAADSLTVITGGTERMRIDSVGGLSLGTTVVGGAPAAGSAEFHKDADNYVRIWDNATGSMYLQSNGANAPVIISRNSDADEMSLTVFQRVNAGGALLGQARGGLQAIIGNPNGTMAIGTYNAKALTFATSNTERVRIASDGYFLIGKTAVGLNTAGLEIDSNGVIASTRASNASLIVNRITNTDNSGIMVALRYNASDIGSISTDGSNAAFNTSSDYRLKENIVDLTGAVTRVKSLQPRRFNFKAIPDVTKDGFIAHEASAIVPEAVNGTKDGTETLSNVIVDADGSVLDENRTEAQWISGKEPTLVSNATDEEVAVYGDPAYASDTVWHETLTVPQYQGIDQAKLVPLLTAAIQELATRVEALEAA